MLTKGPDLQVGTEGLNLPSLVIAPGEVPSSGGQIDELDAEVWRDNMGAICAYATGSGGHHEMVLPGLARFSFDERAAVVRALADPSVDEGTVRDAFYRCVLPMALHVAGAEALHASAVRAAAGVVALCAVSETGKSTLAYGLSQRGYDLWADDVVVFDTEADPPAAFPTPFRLRLHSASAAMLGQATGGDGVGQALAMRRDPAPLAAIYVLERDSAGPPLVIEPLSPVHAFSALLSHAYCYSLRDRERKRRMLGHYLELTQRVPVCRLRFQPGLERLPALLDRLERLIAPTQVRD